MITCSTYIKKILNLYYDFYKKSFKFKTSKDCFDFLTQQLILFKKEFPNISENDFNNIFLEGYDNSLQGDDDLIRTKYDIINEVKTKFNEESQKFFSENNMLLLFNESINNTPTTEENTENNNEKTLTISSENTLDLGKEFLFTHFKDSVKMQEDFEKIAKNYLVKSFLVDYEGKKIIEKNEINDQVRKTQLILVDQIITYLKQLDSKSKKGIWINYLNNNFRINELENTDVFNENTNSSTGLYEALLPLINLYINVQSLDTSMLNNIHKNKNKDSVYYNAIMAVTLLNNFNSYLKSIFGEKNIDIQNVHQKLNFTDSYFFSKKGDGNITTYRVDDDIDVIKETNSITKLLFETVPYYVFNSGQPIPGQYLSFSQASRVIGDIKTLGKNSYFRDINVFNNIKKYIRNNSDDFSNPVKNLQNDPDIKSVSDIIAKIRYNPQKYFSILLELLCNSDINEKLHVGLNLNSHVLNIMYSMYRTLFSNKHNSLKSFHKNNNRLYPQITQFIDTVYRIELVLYNTNEEGINYAILLSENEVNNLKKYLELNIYQFNAKNTGSYIIHKDKYNIQENLNKESKFDHITFTIPNTNYQFKVNSDGNVKILENNKQIIDLNIVNNDNIRKFIEDILHVQIGLNNADSEFFIALKSILKSIFNDNTGNAQLKKMLEMAARVLLYQHVNANSDSKSIDYYLTGNALPNMHKIFKNELMMIRKSDFKDIVPIMAEAMCIVNGNVTASQVKNGEGKAQGITTLSRLMNSKNSQWLLLNKRKDSVVKDFSLYRLIEDVYVTVEKYDLRNVKPVNKFSISEGIYSQFILDFIGGLVDHSNDRNVFGNGKIGILSSVNADKNTVAKLVLDLNDKEIEWVANKKTIRKAIISNHKINISNEEFIQIINYELGNYYYNHMKNIQNDWATLLNYLGVKISSNASIHVLLNEFNNLYINSRFENETLLEFLSRVVAEYNLKSNNFLEFIDQIHYIETKEGFTFNKTTESLLYRFNSEYAKEFDIDEYSYLSSDEFWQEQDFNLFKSLYESGFLLKLVNTKNVKGAKDNGNSVESLEHSLLLSDYNKNDETLNWVKQNTKEFIYAKIYISREIESETGIKNTKEIINITSSLSANSAAKKLRSYLFEQINNAKSKNKPTNIFYINGENVHDINNLLISDLLRITDENGRFIFEFNLNNRLRQYNYLDYLFSQEYLISTVGSHVAHPDKNKIDILNNSKLDALSEESARFNAQHKRNVSQTATMKEYQLNDIFGVSTDMNVAIVKDIEDFQNTVNGDSDKVKPYDGACIVNPFMVLLENYSLGADAAGYVKKPFFHAFKEKFGTGVVIKTAGFGITNDNLRNLNGTKILMKKMTNRRWRDQTGQIIGSYNIFDIKIKGSKFKDKKQFNEIFYMKDGVVYRRSLEYISGVTYKVSDFKINDDGTATLVNEYSLNIDTNYKLWNAFGGEYSCHYDNKKHKYVYDESSIEAVVEIMNSTGYVISKDGEINYQDDFYQPLKHSDIHYLATEGAIKQGASNINSAKVYNTSTLESDDYDDLSLSYMKIKLYQAGILLDKEHHADKAELSLMTQVISACALKGYTISEALHLYLALASIGEALLSEFYDIVKDYVTLGESATEAERGAITDKIRELLYDTLLSTLSKLEIDLNNIASAMAYRIILRYRNNDKEMTLEDKQLPISDTTMFKKLVANLAVYLSNKGIKVKVQGILAVLNPSYDLFKLYNGKKLEEFKDSQTFVATEGLEKSWMSESKGLIPTVKYPTTEIRNNIGTKFGDYYFQLELGSDGIYNLYKSLNYNDFIISSDEYNELLIGVALYLPINSTVSSFIDESSLNHLLELGFKKTGTRPLEDGKVVPILTKVKSLPKELLLELLNALNLQSESLIRLGNSYFITRRIENDGNIQYVTDKLNIITIDDYKKLCKESNIISIRPNYADGNNLNAYNIVYNVESPSGKKAIKSLYDSDAIYWQNQFKQIVKKCSSSKKLLDFLKFKSEIDATNFNNRVINGETFENENLYYDLIQEFINADNNNFGGFYFQGKNIENFIEKDSNGNKYVNVSKLNTFVLARLSRIVQHNLSALSETREKIENKFEEDQIKYFNENSTIEEKNEIHNYWKRYIVGVLKEGYDKDFTIEEIFRLVQQYINNTTSILINGVLYKVDPNNIEILAHQCVMPKTMATKYGLELHDNLSNIKNDIGFFYKRFKQKYQRLLTNDNDFTLELKRINGDHVYLLSTEDYESSKNKFSLKLKSDVYYNNIDGNLWRVDALGNRIHQVSSKNDEIYVNEATGVEVIKTDNLTFYLDNLHYLNIEISKASVTDSITGEVNIPEGSEQRIDNIINAIKSSTNKIAKQVYNYYKNIDNYDNNEDDLENDSEDTVTYKQIALGNIERSSIDEHFTDKSDDEVILDYLRGNRDYIPKFVQRMIRTTLEIHSSFLMSLNILAARIPAQCMQSFMAMEVVAFNNSDTSNAYVATSQIYLQGSDFDIDAVSLETFSFDSTGRFYDWSPYFNLSSYANLKKSLNIPFPTFLEVTLVQKTKDNEKYINDSIIKLFIDNGFIIINEDAKTIKFNIKDIENLIKFLSIDKLPSSISINQDNEINELLLKEVLKFINNHNMYFSKKSVKHIEGASANYAMYNSYKIAADPANLIQAMTSVDSTTRPMKTEGNKSKKAKALANRGPGNWINKIEAINENAVGKDCIAICATGIKVFTAATFTNNYILNSEPELLKFLPFEVKSNYNELGEKINVTKKLLANIKAKNPTSVTNEEVYELLLSVNDDVDAALVLSALLSLSTDNAKELQLSKLNATAEMIGMYIYGISIGMDFRDLARTLMSDTGELIMKLRNADTFNDNPVFYNFNSIFEHLEMEPNLQAYSYKVNGIRSPKSFLDEFLQKETDNLYGKDKSKDNQMTLTEYLFRHIGVKSKDSVRSFNIYDLKNLLEKSEKEGGFGVFIKASRIKDSSENSITDSDYEAFKIIWNLMFDYLAEWYSQHKSVSGYAFIKELNKNIFINSSEFKNLDDEIQEKYKNRVNYDYIKIKRLAEGASEMRIAGLMLGINKGFKSTIDDIIALQSVITKAFNDRKQWKTLKTNLYNFKNHLSQSSEKPFIKQYATKYKNSNVLHELVFDENKKNNIIEEYDEIKHTFNLPLILTTQPNYHEYYKALVSTDVLLNNGSFLYKALTEIVTDLSQDLKVYSANEISNIRRGVEKYITHKIINNFLNSDDKNIGGQILFEVPTNSSYVNNNGDVVINKGSNLTFKTGNDATNYTLKMLMELTIIPKLLKGELTPGSNYVFVKINPFISNLVPIVNDRTYTKVPTIQMTSNINLLPTNPEEDMLFKHYRDSFKEISGLVFSSGTIKNTLADLFFVYDLFVNNNALSLNSFKKFFVSPIEIISNLQVKFYNYINLLDSTIKNKSNLLKTIFGTESLSEIYSELLPYVLRPYSGNIDFATSPYLVTQSEDGSITVKIKSNLSDEEIQILLANGESEHSLNTFESISTNVQLNPITFYGMKITDEKFISDEYPRKKSEEKVKFKYKIYSVKEDKFRIELEVNGKIYNLEREIKNNNIISKEEGYIIDKNFLVGEIEKIINPC